MSSSSNMSSARTRIEQDQEYERMARIALLAGAPQRPRVTAPATDIEPQQPNPRNAGLEVPMGPRPANGRYINRDEHGIFHAENIFKVDSQSRPPSDQGKETEKKPLQINTTNLGRASPIHPNSQAGTPSQTPKTPKTPASLLELARKLTPKRAAQVIGKLVSGTKQHYREEIDAIKAEVARLELRAAERRKAREEGRPVECSRVEAIDDALYDAQVRAVKFCRDMSKKLLATATARKTAKDGPLIADMPQLKAYMDAYNANLWKGGAHYLENPESLGRPAWPITIEEAAQLNGLKLPKHYQLELDMLEQDEQRKTIKHQKSSDSGWSFGGNQPIPEKFFVPPNSQPKHLIPSPLNSSMLEPPRHPPAPRITHDQEPTVAQPELALFDFRDSTYTDPGNPFLQYEEQPPSDLTPYRLSVHSSIKRKPVPKPTNRHTIARKPVPKRTTTTTAANPQEEYVPIRQDWTKTSPSPQQQTGESSRSVGDESPSKQADAQDCTIHDGVKPATIHSVPNAVGIWEKQNGDESK